MIEYQNVNTPYGECLLAEKIYRGTEAEVRKIVFLEFEQWEGGKRALQRLLEKYEGKEEIKAFGSTQNNPVSQYTFETLLDTSQFQWGDLVLEGSEFQLKVWKTLFKVAPGEIISYSQLAQRAGYGQAVRAVASVVASNPISLIIPCHRIVRKEVLSAPAGKVIADYGNYRWGREVKRRLIEWERGGVK